MKYYFLFIYLLISMAAYCQSDNKERYLKKEEETTKNQIGLSYKNFLPVKNRNSDIIKMTHSIGLSYLRKIGNHSSIGLSAYYCRSEFFKEVVGIEPYFKYNFLEHSEKSSPFIKASLGFQIAYSKSQITYTETTFKDGIPSIIIGTYYYPKPQIYYSNFEVGYSISLWRKYMLEPSIGYFVSVRNFRDKPLDAFLNKKPITPGSSISDCSEYYHFEPINFSFGVSLLRNF